MTTGKLDTRLEPTGPKFTDYSLEKYEANFGNRKIVVKKILKSGIIEASFSCCPYVRKRQRKFSSSRNC